ncbi:MAG: hypothetical protein E7616_09475 [Ruminococcaceae bacterium]|nr:hypothetical protein [Oscillospiraceae bacterium]
MKKPNCFGIALWSAGILTTLTAVSALAVCLMRRQKAKNVKRYSMNTLKVLGKLMLAFASENQ